MNVQSFKAVVIGGSAGSTEVMVKLFSYLPERLELPIIFVNHLHPEDDGGLVEYLSCQTALRVEEAADKEHIEGGTIYVPPADYHLLVESDLTFSLSIDRKVKYSRPSIDVLFESAAMAWNDRLIGIVLTGASHDGSDGVRAIHKYGGLTIAQNPDEATYPIMPQAAITTGCVDKILPVAGIGLFLQACLGHNTVPELKKVNAHD
ncbi:MAG: chemotaxis protein CheB [Proteobacteria bacterium]|nr:chemotaxis protein CheB [Pseudomonadota bacterium]MBU1686931.1 chemotaxis protein CheB [Pseudomonadota bacterium]